MKWKIVQAAEDDQQALTSGELLGISILLTHNCGEPRDEYNVYWRAREKIQPQVCAAIDLG